MFVYYSLHATHGFGRDHKLLELGLESKAHNEAADTAERVEHDKDPGPGGEEVLRSGHGDVHVSGSVGNFSSGISDAIGINDGEIKLSGVVSSGDSSSCRPGFAGNDDNPDEVSGLSASDGHHSNGEEDDDTGETTNDGKDSSSNGADLDDETPEEEIEELLGHIGSLGHEGGIIRGSEGGAFGSIGVDPAVNGGAFNTFGDTFALLGEIGVAESVDSEESDDDSTDDEVADTAGAGSFLLLLAVHNIVLRRINIIRLVS